MRFGTKVVAGMVALYVGMTGAALASGYAIYEQGAEAMANAGAFTARANNASALFFNPAGILQLDGIWFDVGTTAIFLTGSEFESDGTFLAPKGKSFDQEDMVAYPTAAYYTQKLSDRLAWGLAITSPFGLKTKWDERFEGRFISRESNLAVININPNMAFRLGGNWTGAVGVDYSFTDIRELSRNLDLSALAGPGVEGFSKLDGDGDDVGWNVAVHWASESGWRWGASYRSEMEPDIDGDVDFQNIPAPLAALFPDGGASAQLPLPATLATGVAFVSKDQWEAEFDIVWTDWSTFSSLEIDIDKETAVPNPVPPPALIPVVEDLDQVEEWDDTYSFRGAFSYHVNPRHEWRVGAYFDQNPVPDDHIRPRLPDADRTSVQLGYGYTSTGKFRLDVAYMALFFEDRTAEGVATDPSDPVVEGEYTNFTNLLGVSLSWVLGSR